MFSFFRRKKAAKAMTIEQRIAAIEAHSKAMHEAQLDYNASLNEMVEKAVDKEVQRHIDDLDIDSVIDADSFAERINEVLRDELSDARIKLDLR